MSKKNYTKPIVLLTNVVTECSIATASIHIGNSIGNYIPNVDDFEATLPTDGFGDL